MLTSIEPSRRGRITAISRAVQRRPIVLVLGMHRSGTSLCSHILSALGIDMADNIAAPGAVAPTQDNPHGHWERWEIVEFHDRILSLFNRDYLGHFHDFALPVAWWADPRVAEIRREIVAFLERRIGDGYFGFKDPRTVRLMPMWHQILNELRFAPRIVLCLRNPAQVARSLHARDGFDPANGEYRWLVHMIDFFRYTSNFDFCTVEYEDWFDNPASNIEKLRKFLDLPWQQSEADLSLVVSGIVDMTARHDDSAHREASQPLVRTLYKLAGQVGQDAKVRDQIAYIVSQFVGFQQLQRPLEREFEHVAKIATKFPAIEQEAAALRMQISERDTGLASAQLRADAAEARLADAAAKFSEIEQEAAALRMQVSERDTGLASAQLRADAAEARLADAAAKFSEIEQEAAALRMQVSERDTGLASAQLRADAAEARLADVLAEIEGERAHIGELGKRHDEHEAAATAMQGEITTLRDMLARAEREACQRGAAAQVLEAQLRGLRERSAEANREATEHRTAVAALQAEIATLQGTLTAAREIGKAAVAAFRLDVAAPAKSDARRGGFRLS
jgi:hypothetical protein